MGEILKYYALYLKEEKEEFIFNDYKEADKIRKGKSNECKKFSTREEAQEWLEIVKSKEPLPSKINYYAIYFIDENEGIIKEHYTEMNELIKGKHVRCKKFKTKGEAEDWLEGWKENKPEVQAEKEYYAVYFINKNKGIVTKSAKELKKISQGVPNYSKKFYTDYDAEQWIEMIQTGFYEVSAEQEKDRYYAVYFTDEERGIIVNSLSEARELQNGVNTLLKKFKSEKKAEKWIEEQKQGIYRYFAMFFTKENYGFITRNKTFFKKMNEEKTNINKVFETVGEADKWLRKLEKAAVLSGVFNKETVYFDAGTGRGIGVEVRITDYKGNSLLSELEEYKKKINTFGNYNLGEKADIGYGELYGMYLALLAAQQRESLRIAGDNQTVLNEWSLGKYNSKKFSAETVELIEKVVLLRKQFCSRGGEIFYISGNINPADLGFHKDKKKREPKMEKAREDEKLLKLSESRKQIIKFLSFGEKSRKEIQEMIKLSQPRVIVLLNELTEMKLVERIGKGKNTKYRNLYIT